MTILERIAAAKGERRLVTIKNTSEDMARGTVLLTGAPRTGKTTLAYYLAEAVVGKGETFVLDFPEEEGTSSLADCSAPYVTLTKKAEMDEVYSFLTKEVKPKALVWDGLPASYEMMMRERVPTGVPPEDHGKTWRTMELQLKGEIVRFKMIPSVEFFVATSLIWPDESEITQEKKNMVTLPGKLKGNIYGLFSYNANLVVTDGPKGPQRVLELLPTQRTVAGIRAPLTRPVEGRVPYDLRNKDMGAEFVAKKMGLIR